MKTQKQNNVQGPEAPEASRKIVLTLAVLIATISICKAQDGWGEQWGQEWGEGWGDPNYTIHVRTPDNHQIDAVPDYNGGYFFYDEGWNRIGHQMPDYDGGLILEDE